MRACACDPEREILARKLASDNPSRGTSLIPSKLYANPCLVSFSSCSVCSGAEKGQRNNVDDEREVIMVHSGSTVIGVDVEAGA